MFKLYGERKEFFQWDLNQKIIVEDSSITEVHFCNGTEDCALVCEVYEESGQRFANVPNIILQSCLPIRVYAYCGDCYTKVADIFKVRPRNKPADYVYTETEIKSLDELESRMAEAEKVIEKIKDSVILPSISSTFGNNSWATIAEVAKRGIAQNYWNVGDYKMLNVPVYTITRHSQTGDEIKINQYELMTAWSVMPNVKYEILCLADGRAVLRYAGAAGGSSTSKPREEGIYPTGSEFSKVVFTITESFQSIPATIIGFNHDKVSNKIHYGRDRAGITLQLGANRNIYGDSKVGVFDISIDCLMAEENKFKAPNSVLLDCKNGATNWSESGFRVGLQKILNDTEVGQYITAVRKQTSHHWQEGQRWAAYLDTNDKVFLPSEYEYYGEVLYAPAREGEQYELYRDGYSKFMWTNNLLEGTAANDRIHFRSAVANKVNTNNADSSYNCGMYLTVKSLNPVSVSYAHSYAAGGAYIAPCFCL